MTDSILKRMGAHRGLPSISTEEFIETGEVLQGRYEQSQFFQGIVGSNARDAGNDPTTLLRPGLMMGIDSNDDVVHFDPDGAATNSGGEFFAVMQQELNMGLTNQTDISEGSLLVAGVIDPNKICLASQSTRGIVGLAAEFYLRKLMARNFILEDNPHEPQIGTWNSESAEDTSRALVETERDKLFHNTGASGAVDLDLPATPKRDLAYYFQSRVAQDFSVTSVTTNDIIIATDIAATTITIASANVGGSFWLVGNGSKWEVRCSQGTLGIT